MEEEFFAEGSKEEMMKFQRTLDFGEDKETGKKYQDLNSEFKSCVCNVLKELVGGKEFFGYNLSNFFREYKNAEPSIAQLKISMALEMDAEKYLPEGFYDVFCEQGKGKTEINKQLDYLKKTISPKEGSETYYYAKRICDYFLTDMDVLEKGLGRAYWFKDKWHERYSNDKGFATQMNEEQVLSVRERVERYEEYLIKNGQLEEGESVLEETWLVPMKVGWYLMLKQQEGKKNELKAVKNLITELYDLQHTGRRMDLPSVGE